MSCPSTTYGATSTKLRTQRHAGDIMKSTRDSPILVTGAAGAVGAIGRNLTGMLLAKGHKVGALVRREDERAGALRRLGAEVVQGDLTDLASMHRAIEGCARIYFGMSVSPAYLEARINTAAVAQPGPSHQITHCARHDRFAWAGHTGEPAPDRVATRCSGHDANMPQLSKPRRGQRTLRT